ncbi:NlpC/P60 family protein [Deinococcus reticulitermitis]|uniref:NlpC/P60 family protein n=1 Tax=Deinococcus reticulitermitis TaxID=856736 RepID=A0A1H7AC97_9DEIO|nr:C40 family peptidase [Deinococcus reticulitermitis]SEJ61517.1 NlpC/P60 family protein [Deinococcus reticulitermitis]
MIPPADPRLQAHDARRRWAQPPAPPGWRELTPTPAWARARLSLRAHPEEDAAQVSEALPGEALEQLAVDGAWTWVRTAHDRYLGWGRADGVTLTRPPGDLTVTALRAHAYAGPRVSRPRVAELCFGARLGRAPGEAVTEKGRRWCPVTLPDGEEAWVQEVIVSPLPRPFDVGTFARRFLEVPYVWGGRSAWGLDCSGLTQLVYAAWSRPLPRDADQQEAALRRLAPSQEPPQPGDLAFFEGHVGLMLGERELLHANATHMRVTVERLGEGEYGARLLAGLRGYGRWPA